MTTTLSTKGQVVIPLSIRQNKKLKPGDILEIEETEQRIILRKPGRVKPQLVEKSGLLVLHAPNGAPTITSAAIKQLEREIL